MTNKEKVLKEIEKIFIAKQENKDFSESKEKILKLSNEPNKEELLNNLIYKMEVFLGYEEEEEKELKFPFESWVDSFFET